jgi:soluble lytic murein transglycosylase-like protein/outer membrane protein assembly factor BamD (BamD/ComL family)
VLGCVWVLGLAWTVPAHAADPWVRLREAVQAWRTQDLDDLPATLDDLRKSRDHDVETLAIWLHARLATRQGDGKTAMAELQKIKGTLRPLVTPAWDWAWIQALQAAGRSAEALARLAEFRTEYKDFRWAAADLLYSRLYEQVGPPETAAEVALALYDKSQLHLPRDELLARAARVQNKTAPDKAKVLWKRLLMKHPESEYVDEARQVVDPALLSDAEQFERLERLFGRRAYERCRQIGLQLWAKGYRKSEVGYYLGKIGSERLRDDYPGAVTWLEAATDEKSPLASQALASYALVLGKSGRTAEAVATFDKWLAKYPDAPLEKRVEVQYDRARTLRMAGKPLQAAQDLQAFLDLHKSGYDVGKYLWFVGFWTYLGGDCDKALTVMQPLLKNSNPLVGGKARYWTGRCLDKLGQRDAAVKTMTSLVKSMPLTWYAALAEDRLRDWGEGKLVPKLRDLSKVVTQAHDPFAGLKNTPELHRLKIATFLGEADTAQRVWGEVEKPLVKKLGKAKVAQLEAGLADPLERYAEAREQAFKKNHGDLRELPTPETVAAWRAVYPRAYATHVVAASKRYGAPEWMVYAHMLQESRYKPWLISGAPAYGLLELLDRTAARLAREGKDDYQLWMLMQPAWNVRWGAQYLGALYKKFHQQLPFAIGSYNGGPMLFQYHMKVSAEMKLGLDEMIDDLGPHESRNYVRMVVGHFLRYLAIYETPKRAAELREQLIPKDWKNAWLPYPDY